MINFLESLELISKVALHVNESMRQVDNFKKLMEVQKKLIGDDGDNLISPSRVSLKLLVLLPGHFCNVITHRDGYTDTQYTGTDTDIHTPNLLIVAALQFSSVIIIYTLGKHKFMNY